ncbi:conserved hypothetical protein [uncultured Desulfobacterium sp.]|uniref:Lipoprotein n=1 Tax=uncultured Desulfobacterium sp. TaxID=201089 RepID=A0A445N3Y0_9BACT|nr:conserved hypothetical protein [uncultured Desulfobacterium sp.]
MKKSSNILVCALSLIIFQGCGTFKHGFHPLPPVTFEEVIRLTQDKVPPDTIIKKIRESHTVFRLNSEEVTELRRQGVDPKVVDFMMNTYVEQLRRKQEMEDWNRWWFYGGHYYWWPDWDDYYYPRIYRQHHFR